MLAHRLRRWPIIKPTLAQRLVLAENVQLSVALSQYFSKLERYSDLDLCKNTIESDLIHAWMECQFNAVGILGERWRRWPNVRTALVRHHTSDGMGFNTWQ